MIKKIAVWVCLALLSGCGTTDPFKQPMFSKVPSVYSSQTSVTGASAKIAMLVPLSGASANVGEDLKKAGMMAQFDKPESQTAVIFYDTKGTPAGVKNAYQEAMKQQPNIIVGPLFSAEVGALKDQGVSVPVLSFTSDDQVLSGDIYTVALTIPEQINRIVAYACSQGQRKLAVIGPENKVGEITMNTLASAIKTCPGMEIHKVSLYNPKTVNFEPAIMKLVPKPVDPRKRDLSDAEKRYMATPIKDRVAFDSLLVFEDGVKLQQVMSMLAFYDVTPTGIPMYGLSSWQNAKDNAFIGGYFPMMPENTYQEFAQKFQENFGSEPSRVASYAYDAVSLAALLGNMNALNTAMLTQQDGFNGVNGRVRLNPDGTNTRLLDMMQIKSRGRAVVVDPAPTMMPPRQKTPFWSAPDRPDFQIEKTGADY